MNRFAAVIAVCLFSISLTIDAQPVRLNLSDALERARTAAPAVAAARLQTDEARARLVGASRLLQSNPELELRRAQRSSHGESSWDQEVTLRHPLDLRRERSARIRTAEAMVQMEEARVDELIRDLQIKVAHAHALAVAAAEHHQLAAETLHLADAMAEMMLRRFEAGDVAQLDLNLTRSQQARARAAVLAAAASEQSALASLAALLGYGSVEIEEGRLVEPQGEYDLTSIRSRLESLPALRVLDSLIAEAEGELELSRSLRWPEMGVEASWAEEEGDQIIGLGVGFSLPVYGRGDQLAGVANARITRLRAERAALLRSYETALTGAAARHQSLVSAAVQAKIAVDLAAENETLALESYEGGQIGLAELLLVRRESADARLEWVDRLLEARRAAIEVETFGGFRR